MADSVGAYVRRGMLRHHNSIFGVYRESVIYATGIESVLIAEEESADFFDVGRHLEQSVGFLVICRWKWRVIILMKILMCWGNSLDMCEF